MSRRPGSRPGRTGSRAAGRLLVSALAAAAVSACAFPVGEEMDRAAGVARYATHYDHRLGAQNNLLDRALAECAEKTLKAETACVRDRVAASGLTTRALMALVPRCRAGQVCHYDQTTRDRLGFVEVNATDYVKHWRIDLDLRKPAADAAHVPLTVIDRDDFEAPPGGAGRSG